MYAARAKDPIPYTLSDDSRNDIKTKWFLRAHGARSSQEYGFRRDRESKRQSVPPEEMAAILTKIDCEFLAAALVRIENWNEPGDVIEDAAEIRAIIDDLDLPTIIELVLMSQSTMRLRAAEKNS